MSTNWICSNCGKNNTEAHKTCWECGTPPPPETLNTSNPMEFRYIKNDNLFVIIWLSAGLLCCFVIVCGLIMMSK